MARKQQRIFKRCYPLLVVLLLMVMTLPASAGNTKIPYLLETPTSFAPLFPKISSPPSPSFKNLQSVITPNDAVAIWDPNQKLVFSHNLTRPMVPASTLKVLTSLFAIETLGIDTHFKTEFYIDDQGTLKIKGYGDPFIITEEVVLMALALKKINPTYTKLVIDDTYFDPQSDADGRSNTFKAYDAPTGAFCVNFNTVAFRREAVRINQNGRTVTEYTYVSDDKIPLPIFNTVLPRIKASKLAKGRIMVSPYRLENLTYACEVIQYLFHEEGIEITGPVEPGKIEETDRLIYTHYSTKTVGDAVRQTLEVSSNYIANQLFLLAGVALNGEPANYPQSAQAMQALAKTIGVKNLRCVEGSGLSRQNSISPNEMKLILDAFEPYRDYLRQRDGLWYKTGTLNGVSCLVGFIHSTDGWYTFTIFRHTPSNQKAFTIADEMKKELSIVVMPSSILDFTTTEPETNN